MACILCVQTLFAQTNACVQQLGPANTSQVAYSMYFESKVKDIPQCGMSVTGGKITVAQAILNPAMSCSDMFGWKLFTDAVTQQFWKNWAGDPQTFPGCVAGQTGCNDGVHQPTNPLPICTAGSIPGQCCDPSSLTNPGYGGTWNPASLCPYFPGDHTGQPPAMEAPLAARMSKAHTLSFVKAAGATPAMLRGNASEPPRVIRQTQVELVFRNREMWSYVFRNGLYYREGMAKVIANANAEFAKGGNPPYRIQDPSGAANEIRFPPGAIMIKSNWLDEETAIRMGLKDDPPHVKMEIRTPVNESNPSGFRTFVKGIYWLVAFHMSSKDLPNWTWATFEHVDNPGRCDYLGCNDSYGYETVDPVLPTQAHNYTAPKVKCDNLVEPSWIFDLDKIYAGGRIRPGLAGVFRALGIGTGPASPTLTSASPAWLNYRLKGTQTDFTDSMGRYTRLANSVTEGGFANSASCIGCHSRSAIGPRGESPLGVFMNTLHESGYGRSHNGPPVPSWFQTSTQPPQYTALQADFVWGFVFARCLDSKFDSGCLAGIPP